MNNTEYIFTGAGVGTIHEFRHVAGTGGGGGGGCFLGGVAGHPGDTICESGHVVGTGGRGGGGHFRGHPDDTCQMS